MAILEFDKKDLTNLEHSLKREFISTNRAGGYMSTTIVGCNTRRYHGLMVCPIAKFPDQKFVLLSSIDETIIQHGQSFNLAIHAFPDLFEPKGHKYITNFEYTPTPTITYRVGGVMMKKELLWLHKKEQLLIRYTLVEAKSQTTLRLRPFLAFRQTHALSKANMDAKGASTPIEGGVKNRLYPDFPELHMQFNCPNKFYAAPDWYKNFQYYREAERGYDCQEDLLTTGIFEIDFTKNKSVILSCSTAGDVKLSGLENDFEKELLRRSNKTEFLPCLRHSARQFIVSNGEETRVVAGFPWFERRGRHTFISAPWITLSQGNSADCIAILKTMVAHQKDGLFPSAYGKYESSDTSLWFFNALQQLSKVTGPQLIWDEFGDSMKKVLERYMASIPEIGLEVKENGLVWADMPGKALTWMDMYAYGKPVTRRPGYAVEVNALWYNAVCYTLELATKNKNQLFVDKWKDMPEKIYKSFNETFWMQDKNYFADYIYGNEVNAQIRPNQIMVGALPYKVTSPERVAAVVRITDRFLMTDKGVRTLAPTDSQYVGVYEGNEDERALSQHQGSIRTWWLPYFFEASESVNSSQFTVKANNILFELEDNFLEYGVGTLSELYDANPPHKPKGAVSHAISVGAVLRLIELLNNK